MVDLMVLFNIEFDELQIRICSRSLQEHVKSFEVYESWERKYMVKFNFVKF